MMQLICVATNGYCDVANVSDVIDDAKKSLLN